MSTDPKKQHGEKKAPLHLLPPVGMRAQARVHELGTVKYGRYNWRDSEGVEACVYISAIMRHTAQYMEGEDVDEESGVSHLGHIMATCAILLDAEHVGKLIDDRLKLLPGEVPPPRWEPPCVHANLHCVNVSYPVVCGSCVERSTGWTNFKAAEKMPAPGCLHMGENKDAKHK